MNIHDLSPCTALFLDSGGGWNPIEENSFALFRKPVFSLISKNGKMEIKNPPKNVELNRSPLLILEDFLKEGFFAVGFIGYEYSRYTLDGFSPTNIKDGDRFPDLNFLFFDIGEINGGRLEDLNHLISRETNERNDNLEEENVFRPNISKLEYINNVSIAKSYIEKGDIYQINLSRRYTNEFNNSPLEFFLNLYSLQPVPFGCYIDFGEFKLISGSMELFLRKNGSKVVTRPIKGTMKRNSNVRIDKMLISELQTSEKERAENLMIVDLMRNDLSRICKSGTVRVSNLFKVETYSTLHQMVSEVKGYLKSGSQINEIIQNTFPPGSVTGAPKRRTIEIIDEIEPHYRGPYCGAIGIFMPNRDFTLSVAIRITVFKEEIATFWVGGGIVWDSDPEAEYFETLTKAKAIKMAMTLTG
ncbi:aminodeoxychorismate synthase component I [Desulfobacterota bacterium AH_259_B03_O07]|nr:aminodeoxychorismate synthase component I [Desulfobacterota bacterium AH_259_B03_O07]